MPDWVWIQNVVFPLVGMGMGFFFLFGTYRTVNHWIERRHERAMAARGREGVVDGPELRARLETLEDIALRVQDLEERVDFAERVLARQRDDRRLGEGG